MAVIVINWLQTNFAKLFHFYSNNLSFLFLASELPGIQVSVIFDSHNIQIWWSGVGVAVDGAIAAVISRHDHSLLCLCLVRRCSFVWLEETVLLVAMWRHWL